MSSASVVRRVLCKRALAGAPARASSTVPHSSLNQAPSAACTWDTARSAATTARRSRDERCARSAAPPAARRGRPARRHGTLVITPCPGDLGCCGAWGVPHARGWFACGTRTVVASKGKLPCASGTHSTARRRLVGRRSQYRTVRSPRDMHTGMGVRVNTGADLLGLLGPLLSPLLGPHLHLSLERVEWAEAHGARPVDGASARPHHLLQPLLVRPQLRRRQSRRSRHRRRRQRR